MNRLSGERAGSCCQGSRQSENRCPRKRKTLSASLFSRRFALSAAPEPCWGCGQGKTPRKEGGEFLEASYPG